MTNFEKVRLFMKTFGQEVKTNPSLSTNKINDLRISLINEELDEFREAIKNDNIKEVANAGADTFVSGSAIFNQPDYSEIIQEMRDSLKT